MFYKICIECFVKFGVGLVDQMMLVLTCAYSVHNLVPSYLQHKICCDN